MKKPFGRVERSSRRGSSSAQSGQRRTTAGVLGTGADKAGARRENDGKRLVSIRVDGKASRNSVVKNRYKGKDESKRARTPEQTSETRLDAEIEAFEDVIAGRHPVIEALKASRPINKIVIAEGAEGGSLTELIGKARAQGIVIQTAPRAHLSKITREKHQGVVAYVAPHPYAEIEDIVARSTGQVPLVVLLDEVTDPYNLGAVLRTSDATGVQGVIIPKRRAVPLTGVVAKASAGALEHVPVARVANLVQAIDRLKADGYWIVGTSLGEGTTDFRAVDYTGKTAVVIGAEGQGLSRLVAEHCDFLVAIPMLGHLQSLNASVAAGVLLYEIVRQRS